MKHFKYVKIILIILFAIAFLAGCTVVQPQDDIAQTAQLAEVVSSEDSVNLAAEESEIQSPELTSKEELEEKPTVEPTAEPTETATPKPTEAPTQKPTEAPTQKPTEAPTQKPTEAPTQKPTPVPTTEPTPEPTSEAAIVTISIDCRNATEAGVAGAPEGGWILGTKEVELQDADTVWTVLDRICRSRGIAVSKSGSGGNVFIKSIGGVGPIDAKSGWMYSVNGSYVMASAGSCKVKAGDKIRWKYTIDGGDDI